MPNPLPRSPTILRLGLPALSRNPGLSAAKRPVLTGLFPTAFTNLDPVLGLRRKAEIETAGSEESVPDSYTPDSVPSEEDVPYQFHLVCSFAGGTIDTEETFGSLKVREPINPVRPDPILEPTYWAVLKEQRTWIV